MNPTPLVALAGNPNAGKSDMFNALTGARQKVGNYPGVTVERKSGRMSLADGRPVELARKEFELLLALARRSGEVVSKRVLLAEVWQQAYGGADKTVDVHLSWLRRKLGESAAEPRYLLSVRGVGVKLVDPTSAAG